MNTLPTIKRIIEEGDWLTAEDVNRLPASDWKHRGLVFSVSYEGKDYYPRYQFDALYQPLPIIKELLEAYGPDADAWALAAWLHFPNGWIAAEGSANVPVAPKDALHRPGEVLEAMRKRQGTYVA